MKLVLASISFFLTAFIISSCGCNTDCADCETLDEENCECIVDLECQCSDGIQNGNETGIDCGGDCDACFECTTNNCILLSGATSSDEATSKTWNLVDPEDLAVIDKYYSNGKFTKDFQGEVGRGYWKFDNPSSPTQIIVIYYEAPPGWIIDEPIPYPLKTLTSDTLRYQNFFTGEILVFIPEQ